MRYQLSLRKAMFSLLFSSVLLSGCGYLNTDPMHFLIRSPVIMSLEQEKEILSRAKVSKTVDGRITVLHVQGTPYERGYQHGALLRKEVRENLMTLYESALDIYRSEELFAEAYERLRPFIPEQYVEEMQGLAHGSRLPLHVVHRIHALPSMTEWGGKKRLKKIVKKMIAGELGTSCSNIGAVGDSTGDGEMYAVRILDWGLHRISKLHKFPLITVGKPDEGISYANVGWIGFLGAVSGMNAEGITLGEMGYGDPENETLSGKPMVFLLRDILEQANSLEDVRLLIKESVGTNSFGFLMTDGKARTAELYIKDRERFRVFPVGQDMADGDESLPGIADMVYGGHYDEKMAELLKSNRGKLTPRLFMEKLIPDMAMKSNFQNVIYDPVNLQMWISNAPSKGYRAAEAPYTYFDFMDALATF